jgi:hypothetical protein
LHNNDIGNEVYICCETATMTNEGKNRIYIGKTKTFQIIKKKKKFQDIKCTFYNGHEKTSHFILLDGEVINKDVISMLRLEILLYWNRNDDNLIIKTS